MRLRVALVALVVPVAALAVSDPTRRGRYAVGRTEVTFVTTSVTTGAPRVLDTYVDYPALRGTGRLSDDGVRVDATVARGRFPLVVFSHSSCGSPLGSTFLTETLASRGFVVAAPAHPQSTEADGVFVCSAYLGDSVRNRPADVSVVIDALLAEARTRRGMFAHRLDPRRIGVAGHSLGGGTAIEVATRDSRVRAALALAPVRPLEESSITVPTMIQGAELDPLLPQATRTYALLTGPRFFVELLDTGHSAFADACDPRIVPSSCAPIGLGQAAANRLVLRWAVPFLLRYVAGDRRWAPPLHAIAGSTLVAARR
jgi:predicted dienelactone hydrolase